ncbi:N-acetylmuramoyl-L-alanine amidase [Streptomyces zhihengii]|uniref:N-acetylmuramoyl-L-alanine amidase n=1 Tax=Streptomyces zhihengii TaxID=1818004 RepID=A0ABS2UU65_9ACTN|nr:N-acetylmuramoyl-L-alanine amidase [Streptomyces zhihengii]MBM9621039.1 N-acetylmuramoyl-L-alanine amidase [Streptomyces zhihengii]
MATPLSADRLLQALRAEGLRVVEHRSWRTNNRNHKGPWGPVEGVMIHHTVTSGAQATVDLCYNGHSALPGPLCHGVIDKTGTVHLVGYGRTNHAGLGDDDVLRAVMAEGTRPADNEANTDGNRYFWGFECVNLGDGEDPWPAAQLLAIERASAAVIRAQGWRSARRAIGHAEWQPGKIDPRGFTMDAMRGRIATRLGTSAPAPLPAPQAPVVDLSRLITAARTDPARSGTPVTYTGVRTVEAALIDAGLLAKVYGDGHYGSSTVAAYAKWQRSKAGGSYTGAAADGIPGRASLDRLAKRAGFKVVA